MIHIIITEEQMILVIEENSAIVALGTAACAQPDLKMIQ